MIFSRSSAGISAWVETTPWKIYIRSASTQSFPRPQVYLIMYGLMFIAAIRLRHTQPDHPRGYRAPALGQLCALGAASSVAAFLIGFVPPSQFGHASPLLYGLLILAGILALGVLPPLLLEWRRKPDWKTSGSPGSAG